MSNKINGKAVITEAFCVQNKVTFEDVRDYATKVSQAAPRPEGSPPPDVMDTSSVQEIYNKTLRNCRVLDEENKDVLPMLALIPDMKEGINAAAKALVPGDPVLPAAAEGTSGSGNTEIKWTAKSKGAAGNGITVSIRDDVNPPESGIVVTLVPPAGDSNYLILIDLATDALGDVDPAVNTATAIINAVNDDLDAGDIVTGVLVGSGGAITAEDSAELTDGADGSTADAATIRFSATKLWIAVADCTAVDGSGWKYINLT